jgi:hypothetical protein
MSLKVNLRPCDFTNRSPNAGPVWEAPSAVRSISLRWFVSTGAAPEREPGRESSGGCDDLPPARGLCKFPQSVVQSGDAVPGLRR